MVLDVNYVKIIFSNKVDGHELLNYEHLKSIHSKQLVNDLINMMPQCQEIVGVNLFAKLELKLQFKKQCEVH